MTHHFASRFPDDVWAKLEETAKTSQCSINSLLVNTVRSAQSAGTSLTWAQTQTANFAVSSSGTNPIIYNLTSSTIPTAMSSATEFKELMAKGRELLADETNEETEDENDSL